MSVRSRNIKFSTFRFIVPSAHQPCTTTTATPLILTLTLRLSYHCLPNHERNVRKLLINRSGCANFDSLLARVSYFSALFVQIVVDVTFERLYGGENGSRVKFLIFEPFVPV